jgi:hypothetical protein
MTRPHVTVIHGLRGYFAVLIDSDGMPSLTGIGSYRTPEAAASEARAWAASEGLQYKGPSHANH